MSRPGTSQGHPTAKKPEACHRNFEVILPARKASPVASVLTAAAAERERELDSEADLDSDLEIEEEE